MPGPERPVGRRAGRRGARRPGDRGGDRRQGRCGSCGSPRASARSRASRPRPGALDRRRRRRRAARTAAAGFVLARNEGDAAAARRRRRSARRGARPERRRRPHARRRQRDGLPALHRLAAGRPARRAGRRRGHHAPACARTTRVAASRPSCSTPRRGALPRPRTAPSCGRSSARRRVQLAGSLRRGPGDRRRRRGRGPRRAARRRRRASTWSAARASGAPARARRRARRFDGTLALPPGADLAEAHHAPAAARGARSTLDAGQEVDGRRCATTPPRRVRRRRVAAFQLNARARRTPRRRGARRARSRSPRDADVAVVVVGTTEEVESEGFDRDSLALPGRQDELVRRVAAANPRTVVVVNAGAPVLLPWADEVPAVLLALVPRPGGRQRAGRRAARASPSPAAGCRRPGRATEDGPAVHPAGRRRAAPTTRTCHRLPRSPRRPRRRCYPFGHGLGYTSWELRGAIEAAGDARARARAQHRRPARPRGRAGLRVAPGQRGRAPAALAGRLRRRRGRAGRGGRPSTVAVPGARSRTGTAAGSRRAGHVRTWRPAARAPTCAWRPRSAP